ncbi:MAG TPA: hypothetical protein PK264_02870 [Hyphomicrobiaceae bacterium]|nr:hypothetical protein [Hyphomicrobiaceae bacterium]
MNGDEGSPICPCCMCVHSRHAPKRRVRMGDMVAVLQAVAMISGLVYLVLFEVPDLIMAPA